MSSLSPSVTPLVFRSKLKTHLFYTFFPALCILQSIVFWIPLDCFNGIWLLSVSYFFWLPVCVLRQHAELFSACYMFSIISYCYNLLSHAEQIHVLLVKFRRSLVQANGYLPSVDSFNCNISRISATVNCDI